MKEPVKIRELDRSNLHEVGAAVSLHNAAYDTKRTSEQWFWEYESYLPNQSVFTIAEDDNGVCGTAGMIPIQLNIGGHKYLSGKFEYLVLSPKHRGGTLAKELYEFAVSICKKNGMNCIWGFTYAEKVLKNKFGFSTYKVMFYAVLIFNPFGFFSAMNSKPSSLKSFVMFPLIAAAFLYSTILRSYQKVRENDSSGGLAIQHTPKNNYDIRMLYDCLRKRCPNLIHIEQDKDFLDWRISNNPNIERKTYFVYRGDFLEGYCYITTRSETTTRAFITDFTFKSKKAGSFLLREILKELSNSGINYLFFLGNQQNILIKEVFALLTKFGFLRKKAPFFVFRNVSLKDNTNFYDIDNWYLNGLWTEGYE